jgi:rRNA small subunit pseudouridine methyltransferase Nep1
MSSSDKKRKFVSSNNDADREKEASDDDDETDKASSSKEVGKQVIVILDLATLEIVKTKKGDFQLLNCDDHVSLMRKHNKDPSSYRPDIIHQELMAVLDSPLNKAGKVKVYVHTEKNVLIEINPKTRIPRTFKRFSGLMVQLLHRLKIRSADGKDMLLKVIKNPISRHLPAGAHIYGFSHQGSLHNPTHFATLLPDNSPVVLIFGAMAVGAIKAEDHPYIQQMVSISEYPLSGIVAVNRVLGAIENQWGIV